MASALEGTTGDDIPKGLSWHEVFKAAGWNSITGLTWSAVRDSITMPSVIRDEWSNSARSTAFRRIQFDAERELITRLLVERGVDVLPLKGAAIASLYPSPEMRSMYDNDLLYGYAERGPDGLWHTSGDDKATRSRQMEKARAVVCEVMEGLGYSAVNMKPIESSHDTKFFKAPFLVFEMHHSLMDAKVVVNDYYSDPWRFARLHNTYQNAKGAEGKSFFFPPEETYFYSVAHAYKHSIYGYVGLRALSDEWVLLSEYSDSMDWTRVEAMLRGAGITTYEASLRSLTERVFKEGGLRNDDYRELAHMTRAGTYGAPEDHLRFSIQKSCQSGNRFPRLSVVMTALSPNNAPDMGPLANIANNRLLRPMYPIAKVASFLDRFAKNPKAAGAQIVALIKGPEGEG